MTRTAHATKRPAELVEGDLIEYESAHGQIKTARVVQVREQREPGGVVVVDALNTDAEKGTMFALRFGERRRVRIAAASGAWPALVTYTCKFCGRSFGSVGALFHHGDENPACATDRLTIRRGSAGAPQVVETRIPCEGCGRSITVVHSPAGWVSECGGEGGGRCATGFENRMKAISLVASRFGIARAGR